MQKPAGSLISYMANMVKSKGGINFAQGIPAFEPPLELLQNLEQIVYNDIHQYAPGTGNKKLLGLLEQFYQIPQNQFLMVNGATEAISLLFTYLQKIIVQKFSVLAFDPVYESYKHLPRIFSLPFLSCKLNARGEVDFKVLEELIVNNGVKLILLASPGNPLGKVWTKEEMEILLALCKKHDVYLVIDAVYSDLYFNGAPYFPINKIDANVFYVNAFSKKFSITGWRVGYVISHESHMKHLMDVHDYTGLCVPSVLQQAIANYLESNNYGRSYTNKLRKQLAENYTILERELTSLGFHVFKAEGGYFIWAELPKAFNNGLEFALRLYEKEKVAVVPGIHFSDEGNRIIRVNIARKNDEIIEGLNRIRKFIQEKN